MSSKNIAMEDQISATIHAYTSGQRRYIDEFIQQYKIAADLLQLGIYPDAKEITESYGAYNAVRKYLKQYDPQDPEVTLVSVGDGRSPRTAALFAFKTKWNCISIDHELDIFKTDMWESSIKRLTCIPKKIEDILDYGPMYFKKVVIVAVHSHADMEKTLKTIIGNPLRSLVAIPCCIPWGGSTKRLNERGFINPSIEYNDSGIWSPKNRIKVWKNI
jgi:hypothetical protein